MRRRRPPSKDGGRVHLPASAVWSLYHRTVSGQRKLYRAEKARGDRLERALRHLLWALAGVYVVRASASKRINRAVRSAERALARAAR